MTKATKTVTLSEFLLARIAEDEAAIPAMECHCPDDIVPGAPADRWPGCPDRVVAECEAKRRIVERHVACPYDTTYRTEMCRLDLVDMASIYSDHPDFQQEWAA